MLKRKYEFTLSTSSLDADDKILPELDKTTLYEFGNKEVLIKSIDTQLVEIINQEMSNIDIMDRLLLLINSIYKCTNNLDNDFEGSKIYLFGSRMSGLALKDSDVDLYFCIAGTFGGALSSDRDCQKELVRYFGKIFSCQNNEFKYIQPIIRARVPIVKFLHVPTGLYCDLSFKSGLSTQNTKLIRLYLSLNVRVHWVVCAVVKRWALQNDMKHTSMFTSFALTWLVLFYLMATDVVPPLKLLREHADYSKNTIKSDLMFIEDWDCTFCTLEKAKQIWEVPTISCWDLLYGFFKFYSDPGDLKQFVFCPAIGKAISKDNFHKTPILYPDIFDLKKKHGNPFGWSKLLKYKFCGENFALQDPFDLFNNLTRCIVPRKLRTFSHLCNKTMEVMNNQVQKNYILLYNQNDYTY
ncbi:terminal uridylyltransferase Tailor-like [Acyrthosiphon pisum]|uniref:Poly(A) RNA polymerase mitochondrial-like central palm domain-containing protein n=1 Tax=Acyrthosiphon pisum TaxID=7029 RepID=A0A8R1W632_ACYPI|nr:terminal uridylyltransferase Tailor-like [Acyrthosiphon pisum]|eukprot:XP_003246117.1 PREDICTED: terminal uridylyltransferase 7-like [Acyrthosiphon pisum]